MANQVLNQANYQDEQNFKIDINKVYDDFIIAIDKIRSYTNTLAISNQNAINSFQSKDQTLSKLKAQGSISITPQESRCHAFFRIIGFPVVSKDYKIYNPGYDIIYDNTRAIGPANSLTKLSIAGNPIEGFRNLSINRELNIEYFRLIFNTKSIDSTVLGLSSGSKIRIFAAPLIKNSEPFDTSIENQQYNIDITSLVGKYIKKLTEYIDINGNTPTVSLSKSLHIIKPFIVDPVIDFTVNDASKLVSVPFVPTKNHLMVKDNVFVNRPIIEQVIRDRFTVNNQQSTIGTADKSVIDYIKNIPAIKDEAIVNKISSGDVYKLSEQNQFIKYVNIIRAMMKEIYNAQLTIHSAQEKYYWLPLFDSNGPEAGAKVQGVLLSTKISNDFITDNDRSIINAKVRDVINQMNAQTSEIQGIPDVGGFAFDNFKNTFGPDSSSSLGDVNAQSLQDLTNKRYSDLQKANNALRTIEIIMGEFSGLGLCDIMAVMGALYIMPKNDLLGFLDEDAIKRMNVSLKLNESSPGIQVAIGSFTSTVKDFYNLMDKIYQDISQNNNSQ